MPISYRAFLMRLRRVANIALEEYGVQRTKIRFITYTGNGLYKITVPTGNSIPAGNYALRLHQPNYMNPEFIVSEMEWLYALHHDGINVPKPVRNIRGDWLTMADGGYDVPQARNCTLIRWTEGQVSIKAPQKKHFRALGRVIGEMHMQSKSWKPPKGFSRPHWDWEGLYGDGFSYGVPAADAHAAIPKTHQAVFNDVLSRVREVCGKLGKGKSVYGLIHADLGLGDNIAFMKGEARPFDFDDCGFGYWVFDFGVALSQYMMDSDVTTTKIRDALLEGYEETATLDGIGIEYLDFFIAARLAQFMFFYQASGLAHPEHKAEAKREVNSHAKFLKRFLKVIEKK